MARSPILASNPQGMRFFLLLFFEIVYISKLMLYLAFGGGMGMNNLANFRPPARRIAEDSSDDENDGKF